MDTSDILGLQPTTDELKNSIHEGVAFSYDFNGTIAVPSTTYFLGITAPDQEVHFSDISVAVQDSGTLIEFFEEPTITNNGTAIIPYNLNRASINTSKMELYENPTISSDGNRIGLGFIPESGIGSNLNSGGSNISKGKVLKAGTAYLIKITQTGGTAETDMSISYTYHEPKNLTNG